MQDLLRDAAARASEYLSGLAERGVAPDPAAVARLAELGGALPEAPQDPQQILADLDRLGSPATVATAGPRYFGFVIGGALPATVAATVLASAWDQNAGMVTASPVAAALEQIALDWLIDLLGLSPGWGGAFVSGATTANLCGLAAARHALLARFGWDVEAQGLFGAPELRVVVGEHCHASVLKALAVLGMGRDRVLRVPADDQGRMLASELPALDASCIVCIQAGNVNSGAFDPAGEICAAAQSAGAWVHVDGAFGLWAAAVPTRAAQTAGFAGADSWAMDAHKWLNVPYDSGLALLREPAHLRAAMSASAAYLVETDQREPSAWTVEMSRRARGVEVWAALRGLGRDGLAELVERCCAHARRLADGLRQAGYEVLNLVELNQVLVAFGDDATNRRVIAAIQADGTCWCGSTIWRGRTVMRISLSSWATTATDVERSLAAMLRLATK